MKISELIKRLEQCKEQFGDLKVYSSNDTGSEVEEVNKFLVAKINGDSYDCYRHSPELSKSLKALRVKKEEVDAVIINDYFTGDEDAGF